ncbi:MAG: hypothetical protein CL868_21385 [Cytophagaceae bacterium]|nr:hypothetical protein [Cytophagaceae bacterium]|tara:strand:- start:1953 stop:2174 length:222 start_codon:yes stop_codon:yes gene_type:complete
MGTNKEMLVKGVRTMALSLLFMFLAPGLIYEAASNREHFLYIPVLILGLVAAFFAIYLAFKGLNRILKAMFDN